MTGHRLEVADVFREYGSQFLDRYGNSLSIDQKRAFRAILDCQTAALGGHRYECDHCAHELVLFNSCRNRHCPKCQAIGRAKWMEARASELLPIPHFHVVFTLPREIGRIALQNKRVVYGVLFRAAAETLKELAADPKHLGAEVGVLAVLHTWGQTLIHHPHLHCVLTSGGVSPDGSRWIHCKRSKRRRKWFFVHVTVLSRVFLGKFIDYLKRAFRRGELKFHGDLAPLADLINFERWLDRSTRNDWNVDVRQPFDSADQVLKYLARYINRVAISNDRLVAIKDGKVYFRYKDYADGDKEKVMPLDAVEFIRRFLLHVLPRGFMKIRHYGLLANRFRREKLALCRQLLHVVDDTEMPEVDPSKIDESTLPTDEAQTWRCPKCGDGKMVMVERILTEPKEADYASASRAPPMQRIA